MYNVYIVHLLFVSQSYISLLSTVALWTYFAESIQISKNLVYCKAN